MLEIILKYPDAKRTVITNIKRVSKPGRRVYVASDSIPKVLNGFGNFYSLNFKRCYY